ncbi:MAG TPA: SDR family oxidoreductase [Croceibacterium sp.]|nr:SDR family oxidoreductase [Croceibacterium sp.]
MSKTLANQIALVTGASRGLGRAIAQRLAADGAHVLVHYGRSRDAAVAVVAEIAAAGGSAEVVGADLATPEGVRQLVDRTKALLAGRKLDVLVNNAGIAEFASFEDTDADLIDRQLAVNVRAPFLIANGLLDAFAADARLIFTSSVVARAAFEGALAYSQTKGAVNTLVRSLAATLGPRGIRVNAVAPGAIKTDMGEALFATDESTAAILGMQALKRVGQADDISGVAAFLAGPDSKWVTGQVIEASGGSRL